MKAWLVQRGVPAEQILEEDQSTSTEENFRFARAILEAYGLSADAPVAYVTNAFHCYRAGKYAALVGFSDVRAVYYWVFRA